MLKKVEQWLLPFICCFCEAYTTSGQDLCSVCKMALPWSGDRCFKCGLYLTSGIDSIDCESCRELPPKFDRLCSLFSYQPPITKLVMGLKFGKKLAYGRVMGELLADQVEAQWYQNRNCSLPLDRLSHKCHLNCDQRIVSFSSHCLKVA